MWNEFYQNTSVHMEKSTANKIGLKILFSTDAKRIIKKDLKELHLSRYEIFLKRKPFYFIAAVLLSVLFILAIRKEPPWAACVQGFFIAFIWLEISNYYYIGLFIYAIFLLRHDELPIALCFFSAVTVLPFLAKHDEYELNFLIITAACLCFFIFTSVVSTFNSKEKTPLDVSNLSRYDE